MRVNKQKQITLINNCGAIYDIEITDEEAKKMICEGNPKLMSVGYKKNEDL